MRYILFTLTILLIILTGCQNDKQPSADVAHKKLDKSFMQSHNEFGFKLFQQIAETEKDNIFISPTSVLIALSMLYNGSDGLTKDEIAETLQSEGIDMATLNEMNAALLASLGKETDDITLELANSLWINDNFELTDQFTSNMSGYYEAMIEAIDINDTQSIQMINDWVSEATNEKITKMIEDIPPNMVLLIMNAIYLDAAWTIPFDENATENKPFHLANDETSDIPLMMRQEKFAYLENNDFQAIQLPYGADSQMNMTVILPDEDKSIDQFMQSLSNEQWEKWQEQFSEQEGTILLPKFTLEYEVNLNDPLAALGMPSAFNDQADLTKLVKDSDHLSVSEIKHKSYLDVNEEGTEAAAVTSIMVVEMSAVVDEEPFYMEVNRPFLIAITDHDTDAILFIGAIKDPR